VAPPPDRPRYRLEIQVSPATGGAQGRVTVAFTPDLATDRLVLRLWPNGPRPAAGGSHLETGEVTVAGVAAPSSLPDPTTLVVTPDTPLAVNRTVEISVPWKLQVPGPLNDRVSHESDAMRLGSFFPILAWEPGVGWATDPAVGEFAEASTATTADFDVSVDVPDGYQVLAGGVPDRPGHWTATAMRDFAMSVGHFATATAVAHTPDSVQVTVGVHNLPQSAAGPYLTRVVAALESFSKRFGPYPWPAFTLAVTPGLGGGIEYPGHVMQGPGTLGRTTPHEVGHQWFYSLVGNDQGRDPWLDEGLATYAEDRFEGILDEARAMVMPPAARGGLGRPMTYWEQHRDAYYPGVYVQGAQAMAALGPAEQVDCALAVYVARNAYRIARPPDLVQAATEVFPDAPATLARFGVSG